MRTSISTSIGGITDKYDIHSRFIDKIISKELSLFRDYKRKQILEDCIKHSEKYLEG